MNMRRFYLVYFLILFSGIAAVILIGSRTGMSSDKWSEEERAAIRSLWLGSLAPVLPDPSNKFADDARAVALGHRLFFDKRLSKTGTVACATCHIPILNFSDGVKVAKGIGITDRNTPTIIGSAYSPWLFWDGRKDSLWAQALGPIENPLEHGFTRAQAVNLIRQDADYKKRYENIFGAMPKLKDQEGITRAFANLGKAIAAYERKILPGPGKFDFYAAAILHNVEPAKKSQLSPDERAGLKLFIGEANCLRCHNGPLFANTDFHNTGLPSSDKGRSQGVSQVLNDEFNCQSRFSDSPLALCSEINFAKKGGSELLGAFKTPTLRNLSKTAPYMHAGQFKSLRDVLDHYNRAPKARIGQSELIKLGLSGQQLGQLAKFLNTLEGPVEAKKGLLSPPK